MQKQGGKYKSEYFWQLWQFAGGVHYSMTRNVQIAQVPQPRPPDLAAGPLPADPAWDPSTNPSIKTPQKGWNFSFKNFVL